jgi:cobalt-zinc-cadmium resistance protein CzcA
VALAVTGEYLSVPASVGFIALMGIAVLNGLVLVTCFNQLAARGMPIEVVVRQGAAPPAPGADDGQHHRPGPGAAAAGQRPGSEIQRPLAIVVIGGLLSATVLTLFLLPLLYRYFHRPSRHLPA